MDLSIEKEKIKREIDQVEDIRILRAVHRLLSGYDNIAESSSDILNEPVTDIEMALPGGRTPTKAQIEEWLDREENDEFLTGDEATDYIRKKYNELKSQRQQG